MSILKFPIIISILSLTVAFADKRLPTDIELKAAYCIPIVKNTLQHVQKLHKIVPDDEEIKAAIVNEKDILKRLQVYILSKQNYLYLEGMLVAAKRAEIDSNLYKKNSQSKCYKQCDKEDEDCQNKCIGEDLIDRMDPCNSASFLPF